MKERPILFSGPMVRAILEGRKTQTRRIVKPQPAVKDGQVLVWKEGERPLSELVRFCPYGQPGNRLWVRETWAYIDNESEGFGPNYIEYRADTGNALPGDWPDKEETELRWRPSIHMPRAYSRILLEICSVRVERLRDIDDVDAIAEGCTPDGAVSPRDEFALLWDSINAARGFGWDTNPWTWVIEFRRLQP